MKKREEEIRRKISGFKRKRVSNDELVRELPWIDHGHHSKIVKAILEAGVDVSGTNTIAVFNAILANAIDSYKMLLEARAPFNPSSLFQSKYMFEHATSSKEWLATTFQYKGYWWLSRRVLDSGMDSEARLQLIEGANFLRQTLRSLVSEVVTVASLVPIVIDYLVDC